MQDIAIETVEDALKEEIRSLKVENDSLKRRLIESENRVQESRTKIDRLSEKYSEIKKKYDELCEKNTREKNISKQLESTNTILMENVNYLRSLLEEEQTSNKLLNEKLIAVGTKAMSLSDDVELRYQIEIEQLAQNLKEESLQRKHAQQQKDDILRELEEMTQVLFQEANQMVSGEAREKAEILKSKEELQTQLEEAKSLLLSESKAKENLRLKLVELALRSSTSRDQDQTSLSNSNKGSVLRESFFMKRKSSFYKSLSSNSGSLISVSEHTEESKDTPNPRVSQNTSTIKKNHVDEKSQSSEEQHQQFSNRHSLEISDHHSQTHSHPRQLSQSYQISHPKTDLQVVAPGKVLNHSKTTPIYHGLYSTRRSSFISPPSSGASSPTSSTVTLSDDMKAKSQLRISNEMHELDPFSGFELDPKLVSFFIEIFSKFSEKAKKNSKNEIESTTTAVQTSTEFWEQHRFDHHPPLQSIYTHEVVPCLTLSSSMPLTVESLCSQIQNNSIFKSIHYQPLPISEIQETTISNFENNSETPSSSSNNHPKDIKKEETNKTPDLLSSEKCDFCHRNFRINFKSNLSSDFVYETGQNDEDDKKENKPFTVCKFCKDRLVAVEHYFVFLKDMCDFGDDLENSDHLQEFFCDWLSVRINMFVAKTVVYSDNV